MRPQFFPADAVARLAPRPPARPSSRNEKTESTGGFDSVLREISSTRQASRRKVRSAEPDDAPDRPADKKSNSADDATAGQSAPEPAVGDAAASPGADSSAAAADAANASDASGQTPADQRQPDSSNQPEVSAAVESAASVAQQVAPESGLVPTVLPNPDTLSRSDASLPPASRGLKVDLRPAPAQREMPSSLADGPSTVAEPADHPQSGEGGVVDNSNSQDSSETSNAAAATVLRKPMPPSSEAESAAVPPDESASKQPAPAVTNKAGRENGVAPRTRYQTIGEQQTEAMLNVDVDETDTAEPATPTQAVSSHAKPAKAQPRTDQAGGAKGPGETGEPISSAGVRSAVGDSVAASIAKFLLNNAAAAAGSSEAPRIDPAASPQPQSPSAVAEPMVRAAALGNAAGQNGTLTSGVQGTADVDAAAKVLNAAGGGGRYHLTVQLEPPELGQMRLQIHMQQHAMTLQVDADSPAAARLIESRMSDLRDALAVHGVRMDRADVVVRSPASSDANPQNREGGQGGAGDQGRASAEQFGQALSHGGQPGDSQEQGWSWGGASPDYGQDADMNVNAATTDDDLAALSFQATTELSLDLVA